ncbi:hypothetical protein AAMO2058_001747000, partial [Amorphochlora amoebiformis]
QRNIDHISAQRAQRRLEPPGASRRREPCSENGELPAQGTVYSPSHLNPRWKESNPRRERRWCEPRRNGQADEKCDFKALSTARCEDLSGFQAFAPDGRKHDTIYVEASATSPEGI